MSRISDSFPGYTGIAPEVFNKMLAEIELLTWEASLPDGGPWWIFPDGSSSYMSGGSNDLL